MRKAIGYIRVSTEGQAIDGVSMAAQESRIRAWATLADCETVEFFADAGISGKRADNRPGLQAAIAAACEQGAALVVYSLSRLARSTKDALEISERLDKAGADLVSLAETIDTTTAAGKMVFRMLAVLAEFERDQVSERTRAAMQHKKSAGERVGNVLFGYQVAADGVSLEPCEKEQAIIEQVATLRRQGHSLRKIAAALESEGIENRAGRARWHIAAVAAIVKEHTA